MKVTYICDCCGAIIGSLSLTEEELRQMGVDLRAAELDEAIIKSAPTGDLFIYSLCETCVDSMPVFEAE